MFIIHQLKDQLSDENKKLMDILIEKIDDYKKKIDQNTIEESEYKSYYEHLYGLINFMFEKTQELMKRPSDTIDINDFYKLLYKLQKILRDKIYPQT